MDTKMVVRKIGGGFQQIAPSLAGGGTKGFVGWRRLAEEVMRESGELKPDEVVVMFEVEEQGISFTVEQRDEFNA
jgi:hypothetical protein